MASYLPILYQAIGDRLTGDTGTGGLFNSGTPLVTQLRNTVIDQGQAFPYLVMRCQGGDVEDGFSVRTHKVSVTIDAYIEEQPASGYDPFDRGSKILDRVEGDWDLQSTRVPSFGLDRFTPTLANNWYAGPFQMLRVREAHEPGVLHWIMDFEILVSKQGA